MVVKEKDKPEEQSCVSYASALLGLDDVNVLVQTRAEPRDATSLSLSCMVTLSHVQKRIHAVHAQRVCANFTFAVPWRQHARASGVLTRSAATPGTGRAPSCRSCSLAPAGGVVTYAR